MVIKKSVLLLYLSISFSLFAKENIPDWAAGAVWYQILPERFRNINPTNDPDKESVLGNATYDWQVHPWASDWYKLQVWEEQKRLPFSQLLLQRRYGGDLIGVIEKLPYLKDLGVNVIHLMPVFESPSVEKYDAISFHHIDNNFGLNQKEDWPKIISQNEDPKNWTYSKADEIFIELIKQAHELEMKVVIEAVFNYCNRDFFAFKDLEEKQRESKYKSWFEVLQWDDPMTPDTVEFSYKSWQSDREKPLFKKDDNGLLVEPVKNYVFDATKRWMDPDSNSATADGVDGWFIKHTDGLSDKFWSEWNDLVRTLNENALTITDNLSETSGFGVTWDNKLSDLIIDFFAKNSMSVSEFSAALTKSREQNEPGSQFTLHSQLSSYHKERVASLIANAEQSTNNGTTPYDGYYHYNPVKPDTSQRKIQKLLIAFQLTYPGAPAIFYGDESGMWGGKYPDSIKPMLWREFVYERETYKTVRPDLEKIVKDNVFEQDIFDLYRKLNKAREKYPALARGDYHEEVLNDATGIFIYSRKFKKNEVYVFMNLGNQKQEVIFSPGWTKNKKVTDPFADKKYKIDKFEVKLDMAPKTFRVLINDD